MVASKVKVLTSFELLPMVILSVFSATQVQNHLRGVQTRD